jgi:hypothetical protein
MFSKQYVKSDLFNPSNIRKKEYLAINERKASAAVADTTDWKNKPFESKTKD